MQRQRCHEFAEEKGWGIIKEFSEKGVSGFKVSAKDRDAIQDIQIPWGNFHFIFYIWRRCGNIQATYC